MKDPRRADEAWLIAALAALPTLPSNAILKLSEEHVACDGKRLRPIGVGDAPHAFEARVQALVRHWFGGEVHVEHLTQAFRTELEQPNGATVARLLEVATVDSSRAKSSQSPDMTAQWRGLLTFRLANSGFPISTQRPELGGGALDPQALLFDWPRRLLEDAEFAYASTPFAFDQFRGLPLDQTWVDLYLADIDTADGDLRTNDFAIDLTRRRARRRGRARSARFALEQFNGLTILIGEPGSGKSTLLKWIARQVIASEGRFLLPLLVPLREYVLATNRETMLRYALRRAGVRDAEARGQWAAALAYLARDRDAVLILLDGFDEVPDAERRHPEFLSAISDLAQAFTVVLTTRRVEFPHGRFPDASYYELSELAPESVGMLIDKWHSAANRPPDHARSLRAHLVEHEDLAMLARNPFLLTCCCAVSTTALELQREMPRTRSDLYRRTVDLVIAQHNQRAREDPELLAFPRNREVLHRLTYELLGGQGGPPRYLFEARDVDALAGPDFFPRTLKPSRLVAAWSDDAQSYHFMHATVQEYFAAQRLLELSGPERNACIRRRLLDPRWREVMAFHASAGAEATALWQQLRDHLKMPDRFGILALIAARFIREAGADNGGQQLLGSDMRHTLLQNAIGASERASRWSNVYSEHLQRLDSAWFAEHAAERVSQLPANDAGMVAVYGAASARAALVDATANADQLRPMIRALRLSHDTESVPMLMELALRVNELRREALEAVALIGGPTANQSLHSNLTSSVPGSDLWRDLVRAIGEVHLRQATARLLAELARTPIDDPNAGAILQALQDHPISALDVPLIRERLVCEARPNVRALAASTMHEAGAVRDRSGRSVADDLATAALNDVSSEVRVASLLSLQRHARPQDANWLEDVVFERGAQNEPRSGEERAAALVALCGIPGVARDTRRLRRILEPALQDRELRDAAVTVCDRDPARTEFRREIISLVRDRSMASVTRENACRALHGDESSEAVDTLLAVVTAESTSRLADVAAESLVAASPLHLLAHVEAPAQRALEGYSLRTGALVYDDGIFDPVTGSRIAPTVAPRVSLERLGVGYDSQTRQWVVAMRHGEQWRLRQAFGLPAEPHRYLFALCERHGVLGKEDAIGLKLRSGERRDKTGKRKAWGAVRRSISTANERLRAALGVSRGSLPIAYANNTAEYRAAITMGWIRQHDDTRLRYFEPC